MATTLSLPLRPHHTEVYAWQNGSSGHHEGSGAPVDCATGHRQPGCVGSAAPVLVAVARLRPGTFGGALMRGGQRLGAALLQAGRLGFKG